MFEEYIIIRLMYICGISYDNAQRIIQDLDKRKLLDHLKLNIDRYEDYSDIYDRYYNMKVRD